MKREDDGVHEEGGCMPVSCCVCSLRALRCVALRLPCVRASCVSCVNALCVLVLLCCVAIVSHTPLPSYSSLYYPSPIGCLHTISLLLHFTLPRLALPHLTSYLPFLQLSISSSSSSSFLSFYLFFLLLSIPLINSIFSRGEGLMR